MERSHQRYSFIVTLTDLDLDNDIRFQGSPSLDDVLIIPGHHCQLVFILAVSVGLDTIRM